MRGFRKIKKNRSPYFVFSPDGSSFESSGCNFMEFDLYEEATHLLLQLPGAEMTWRDCNGSRKSLTYEEYRREKDA